MKKQIVVSLLWMLTFNVSAGLELTDTYQDWEHYESKSFDTGESDSGSSLLIRRFGADLVTFEVIT